MLVWRIHVGNDKTYSDVRVTCRYFCHIYPNLAFLERFSYESPMSNFWEIRAVGTELINADRRTDGLTDTQTNMTNSVGALRDLAISPTRSVRTLYNFSVNFFKNVYLLL